MKHYRSDQSYFVVNVNKIVPVSERRGCMIWVKVQVVYLGESDRGYDLGESTSGVSR